MILINEIINEMYDFEFQDDIAIVTKLFLLVDNC